MKTLTALLIVALMAIQAQAGKKYETSLGVAVDTAAISSMMVTAAGNSSWLGDTATHIGWAAVHSVADSFWGSPHHDTAKEYISSIDTVIKLDRIECDTVGLKFVEFDSVTIRAQWKAITCDTVYSVTFVDIWSPKRLLYLKPKQYEKLMELLK